MSGLKLSRDYSLKLGAEKRPSFFPTPPPFPNQHKPPPPYLMGLYSGKTGKRESGRQPDETMKKMTTDETAQDETDGADAVPHIDPDQGLWIPPRFRAFERGIVFRTPRSTIQHFGSGEATVGPYYGMIGPRDFGDGEEWLDVQNPDLIPNKVSIKPYGEPAKVFEVSTSYRVTPDDVGAGDGDE